MSDVLLLPLGYDFIREIADEEPLLFLPTTDKTPSVLFDDAVTLIPLSPFTESI